MAFMRNIESNTGKKCKTGKSPTPEHFYQLFLVSCFFDIYVLLADDHLNNVSYFPFMSIKKVFCVLREGYVQENVQVTLHSLKIMEPRPNVFKKWRDTRTFSNLKFTHCTLLILLIINLVTKKRLCIVSKVQREQ